MASYQIQVRGDWGGVVDSAWRPAVSGTFNQSGMSDEEASMFERHEDAFATLDWIQTHEMPDGEDARDVAPRFRIVEV